MPQAATLTMDLMVATANNTEPGSRTRLEFLKVSKRMAKLVGITAQTGSMRSELLTNLKLETSPQIKQSIYCWNGSVRIRLGAGALGHWQRTGVALLKFQPSPCG